MPAKSRRKAARKATRAKWEAALTKIAAEPAKADEATPTQFLRKSSQRCATKATSRTRSSKRSSACTSA